MHGRAYPWHPEGDCNNAYPGVDGAQLLHKRVISIEEFPGLLFRHIAVLVTQPGMVVQPQRDDDHVRHPPGEIPGRLSPFHESPVESLRDCQLAVPLPVAEHPAAGTTRHVIFRIEVPGKKRPEALVDVGDGKPVLPFERLRRRFVALSGGERIPDEFNFAGRKGRRGKKAFVVVEEEAADGEDLIKCDVPLAENEDVISR